MSRSGDPAHSPGDQIVQWLLHSQPNDREELEGRLFRELHAGYPVTQIRALLSSTNEEAVVAGVWLASELAEDARPIFEAVAALLRHRNRAVRHYALEVVAACARPSDQQAIATALDLVEDPDPAVQDSAMEFIVSAPEGLFRAARDARVRSGRDDSTTRGLQLVVDSVAARDSAAIIAAVGDSDPTLRRYAAAAAVRIAPYDRLPLRHAVESRDQTIKTFAERMGRRRSLMRLDRRPGPSAVKRVPRDS